MSPSVLLLSFFFLFTSSLPLPQNHSGELALLPCPQDDPTFPLPFTSLLPSFTSKITHLIPNKEELKIENVEDIFTCHNHTNGKIYTSDICGDQLPTTTYNWVMFDNNDFSVGTVINQLEFGVKHSEIAYNRSILAAGRMKAKQKSLLSPSPSITFSLQSDLLSSHLSCYSSLPLPLYLHNLQLFVLPHLKNFLSTRGCGGEGGGGARVEYGDVPFPPSLLSLSYEEMCCNHFSFCTLYDGEMSKIMQLRNVFVVGSASATPFCHTDSFFCQNEINPWWSMGIALVGIPLFLCTNFFFLLSCGCRGNFMYHHFFPKKNRRENEERKGEEEDLLFDDLWGKGEEGAERAPLLAGKQQQKTQHQPRLQIQQHQPQQPILHQSQEQQPQPPPPPPPQQQQQPSSNDISEYKNLLACRKLRCSRDHFLHSATFTFICFGVIFGLTELDWMENNKNIDLKATTIGTNWRHLALFFNLTLSWMAHDFFKSMILQLHILSVAQTGGEWAPSIMLLHLSSHLTLHLTIFFEFVMVLDVWFFQRIYFPGNWDLLSTRLFLYSLVFFLLLSVFIFFIFGFFSSFCDPIQGRHVARSGCMTDGLLGSPPAPTSWGQFYARGKVWFDFVSIFGYFSIFLTTLVLLLWCNNGGRLVGWVVGLSGNEELAVYVLLLPLSSGPALTITFEVYGQIPLVAPESETQRKAWLLFVILGSIVTIGIGLSDVLWTYHYFDPQGALENNPLTLIVLFSFFFLSMMVVELATMFELLPKSEGAKAREREK